MTLYYMLFILDPYRGIILYIDEVKEKFVCPRKHDSYYSGGYLFRAEYIDYKVTKISVRNNYFVLYLSSNYSVSKKDKDTKLYEILPLIENKKDLQIFGSDSQINNKQTLLNSIVDEIQIESNILNIYLKDNTQTENSEIQLSNFKLL